MERGTYKIVDLGEQRGGLLMPGVHHMYRFEFCDNFGEEDMFVCFSNENRDDNIKFMAEMGYRRVDI